MQGPVGRYNTSLSRELSLARALKKNSGIFNNGDFRLSTIMTVLNRKETMTTPHLARVLPIQREDKDVYFKRKKWSKNDEDRDFRLITATLRRNQQ